MSATVLIIEPGTRPYTTRIEPTAATLRRLVGGPLEAVTRPGWQAYVNEDGKVLGLPVNPVATRLLFPDGGDVIAGTAVVLGTSPTGTEADVPPGLATSVLAVDTAPPRPAGAVGRQQVVLRIVVAGSGEAVTLTVRETLRTGRVAYSESTIARSLAEVLADPATVLPGGTRIERLILPGTPVIRFDLVSWALATAFAIRGPSMRADLPAGHIEPLLCAPRPYQGQPWPETTLSRVAPDVYLALAGQAGIPVHHIGDQPTTVLDATGRTVPATEADPGD